jgi:DNA-binding IscR family transcriptional regulator
MSAFPNEVFYAMNAIEELHKWGDRAVICENIAVNIGAPGIFLQRILMKLGKAGVISVKRGPGGGFCLTEGQYETTKVLDVLAALGHNVDESKGNRASDRLNNAVYDALNVSLQEFLA